MFVTSSMDQEVKIWDSDKMKVLDKYQSDAAVLDCHWGMPNASGLVNSATPLLISLLSLQIAIALGSSCVRLIDPRFVSSILPLIACVCCFQHSKSHPAHALEGEVRQVFAMDEFALSSAARGI